MLQKRQEKQAAHPLMEKEISFIRSWGQWKELWGKTTQADILHSLLHFGFSIPTDSREEGAERILWYLNIANNHESESEFLKSGDQKMASSIIVGGEQVGSFPRLRQVLARKAFEVLCQSFFKNTKDKRDEYAPSWARTATNTQVLEKIFWFFRLDDYDGYFPNLRFYGDDHHLAIAAEFIRSLCEFAWTCEYSGRWVRGEVQEEMMEVLQKNRPDMITLLFGLRKLDVLLDGRIYKLDKSCMQRLKELAMGFDVSLPMENSWMNKRRKPRTLEEACFSGSQAARILLTLQVKQAEEERFEKIRELNEQRRKAEEALKKL